MFSNTLSATATAADVKALVDSFEANELSWQNFKHICTDGAPAMICVTSGFVTLVKNKWPYVTSSYCLLLRYTLPSKTLHLTEVMNGAVKVINFIRSRAKKSPALPTFGQRNRNVTCGTFVLYQSTLAVERQIPLLAV